MLKYAEYMATPQGELGQPKGYASYHPVGPGVILCTGGSVTPPGEHRSDDFPAGEGRECESSGGRGVSSLLPGAC